jgi:hypothetical protein
VIYLTILTELTRLTEHAYKSVKYSPITAVVVVLSARPQGPQPWSCMAPESEYRCTQLPSSPRHGFVIV